MARTPDADRLVLRRTSRKLRRLRADLVAVRDTPAANLTAQQQRRAIVDLAAAVVLLNQRLNLLTGDTDADDSVDPGD